MLFLAISRYSQVELASNTFLFAIDHPRANLRSSLGPPNFLSSTQALRNMLIERLKYLAAAFF